MKSTFQYLIRLSLSVMLCMAALVPSAFAAGTEEAKQYVVQLGNQALEIIRNNSQSAAVKEQELSALFLKVIDTDWMGKFALGRYWRTAKPEQQKHYLEVYRKFLIKSYVPNFRDYTGETFQVVNVSTTTQDEYTVQTTIVRPNNQPSVRVDYRLRYTPATKSFLIFDIVAEGVSLITTERSEFGTILSQEGIDGLVKKLQAKL